MVELSPVRLVLDNPILTKHRRSRLRRNGVVTGALIVGVLCLLIAWFGMLMPGGFRSGMVFGYAVALQGIMLVIIGSSQIANAIGKVRESNILDFHRISPLPPFEIALGFFLGGPILEYALWLIPMPLAAYAAIEGAPGFVKFLEIELGQVLLAWAFHGLALLTSLMARKPKANVGGMIAFMFIAFGQLSPFVFGGARQLAQDPTMGFFGLRVHWLAFLALYAGAVLAFELIASTRKMRSERMHALSKPQALAFAATATVLLLGAFWGPFFPGQVLLVLYAMVGVGALSTITITPDANEYAKGLRRAERTGHRRLPPWDDLALNRVGVMLIALVILAGATAGWKVMDMPVGLAGGAWHGNTSLSIAIGVLTVAYFGLAYQCCTLASPKRSRAWFSLFLFFAWVVPMLAGAILMATSMYPEAAQVLMAVSPVLGLAMSTGLGPFAEVSQAVQVAALMPSIVFFFLFNNLVTIYRRRVERSLQAAPAKPKAGAVGPEALAAV
jgi:hypothetical protein